MAAWQQHHHCHRHQHLRHLDSNSFLIPMDFIWISLDPISCWLKLIQKMKRGADQMWMQRRSCKWFLSGLWPFCGCHLLVKHLVALVLRLGVVLSPDHWLSVHQEMNGQGPTRGEPTHLLPGWGRTPAGHPGKRGNTQIDQRSGLPTYIGGSIGTNRSADTTLYLPKLIKKNRWCFFFLSCHVF